MASSSYIPVLHVGDPVLAAFKHAAGNGKTADGQDPWTYLSDTLKAHQNVNPALAGLNMPNDQVETLMAAAGAGTAAVGLPLVAAPLAILTGPLGWIAGAILGGMAAQPRTCRIIVVNDTDDDLVPDDQVATDSSGVAWIDCGSAAAVPALPQQPSGWTHVGVVPKGRTRSDGTRVAGVGCYVFHKDGLKLNGTGGVLPFKRWGTGPSFQPALGWLVPQNGACSTVNTFDLDGDGGAATLYSNYVDQKRQAESHMGSGTLWFGAALTATGDGATLTACIAPLSRW